MEPCPIRSSFRFSFKERSASLSLFLSLLFSFSNEVESERFLVENRRGMERIGSVIGFSESEECSNQSSDRG